MVSSAQDGLSVVPGTAHTKTQKAFIDLLLRVPGQHPDTDFGILVDEALSQCPPRRVLHGYHAAVFKPARNGADLVVIDPQAAGGKIPALALF